MNDDPGSPDAPEGAPGASGEIDIRALDTVEDVFAAAAVLDEVWGGDPDAMPPNLMRALAHSGNYVVGLYDGDRIIGASVGFFAAPDQRSMHSHVTGILGEYRSRGLGRALKQHQREWAFARGVGRITWTFDPLIARNAYFNLRVLGGRASEYLVDHYGPMDDAVNRGDESDRLMVEWALAAPASPPQERDVVTAVAVPRDIEGLRRTDPREALEWRYRVRDAFAGLLDDGFVVGGFDERGYLFVRAG